MKSWQYAVAEVPVVGVPVVGVPVVGVPVVGVPVVGVRVVGVPVVGVPVVGLWLGCAKAAFPPASTAPAAIRITPVVSVNASRRTWHFESMIKTDRRRRSNIVVVLINRSSALLSGGYDSDPGAASKSSIGRYPPPWSIL
jgi:hypothetical protein